MRLNFDRKRLLAEKVVKNVCYEKDGGSFFKAFLIFSASTANVDPDLIHTHYYFPGVTRFICLERHTFDICVRCVFLRKVAYNAVNHMCPMIFSCVPFKYL